MTPEIKKALDLALEALEPFSTPNWAGAGVDKVNAAITAIRQVRSAPVQEPEIDGATMAGMDASIGHLSALVDELRLLLGCAMDNFNMLHNAAKPDDGPDMDAIIPAIVFAKFVNQDAALRYAIKHSAHDGMITNPPAAPVQIVGTDELRILWSLINAWRDAPAPALHICGKINSYVLALMQPTPPAQPAVQDAEGENKAVRSFLMLYGQPGLTVGQMKKHMAMSGFKSWPTWVETEHHGAHLTKAGAQLWIRHLFALEPTTPQPVPVKTYHDGKPWPVAPKPWVGLTDEEVNDCIKFPRRNLLARDGTTSQRIARAIEAKLKEKNT
jgi:hypothetical protein